MLRRRECWVCGANGPYRGHEHARWCGVVGRAVLADGERIVSRPKGPFPIGRDCRRCGHDDWYRRPDNVFVCRECRRRWQKQHKELNR